MDDSALTQLSRYIDMHWSLVPLHDVSGIVGGTCTCQAGSMCRSAGKHPRFKRWGEPDQLVRDVREAGLLVAARPSTNWGVATGAPSGVWVLDVDPGGMAAYAEWCDKYGHGWYKTLSAKTGSGGLHLYFAAPDDGGPMPHNVSKRKREDGRVPPGIDVRGDGGQAVLPPSVSAKGAYAWLNWGAELLRAPAWLLELVRDPEQSAKVAPDGSELASPGRIEAGQAIGEPPGARGRAYAVEAVRQLLGELFAAPVGTRNDTAYRVACRLIEITNADWSGYVEETTQALWWDAASTHPEGAYVPDAELVAIWQSATRHVGAREAELPDSWLYGEALPFSSAPLVLSSALTGAGAGALNGAKSGDPFAVPGAVSGAALSTESVDNSREFESDVVPDADAIEAARLAQWNAAVESERYKLAIREEAKRRHGEQLGGLLVDRVERLRGRLLDRDALLRLEPPEMLIPDVLVRDSLARIVGASGHGKSFVALAMAGAVGAGAAFAGRGAARGGVLYIVGESLRGYLARVRAWEIEHQRELDGVLFHPEPVQATVPSEWDPLVVLAGELAPALIVLDTQARMTVGVNENDPSDMGVFVDACERLRAASGACVLLIHHTPLGAERGRGAGSVLGAMQTELFCRKDGSSIGLSVLKQKDGREDVDDLNFELVPVTEGEVGDDGFAVVGPPLGVTLRWTGAGKRAGTRRHEPISDLALLGYAGEAALIAAEVFAAGRGGTKAEFRSVIMTEREVITSRATFYRTWAKLLEAKIIGQVHGTQSYRYIPIDDRASLTEPVLDGEGKGGFYAP